MIWFALIIPIITILILAVFFTRRIIWWEYLLLFFIPLLTIFIGKMASIHSQTTDTEYWNTYITQATYYEEWNEYIHKTCTESYACGRDSKGNTEYCTRTYDCSYVDYHSAYWEVSDNIGQSFRISNHAFLSLCNTWKNKTFINLNRNYHTIDGDAWRTVFPSDSFNLMKPICESHTYENKIQCSKSVFNFREVDSLTIKRYGLFKYPVEDLFNYNPILGITNNQASDKLQKYNAQFGSSRKLHMLILIYNNKPIEAAIEQENLWKGGNKNEFILCIGLSGNVIKWTKVISWTDKKDLKIRVARKIKEMNTFDINKIVDTMVLDVTSNFVKKSFKDFNYISVEPTDRAIFITYIITFILCIGLAVYTVNNRIE